MAYKIASIDIHKRMLAVVVAEVEEADGPYEFERKKFSAMPGSLKTLAEWLNEQDVEEVVMESTAQYWKPVWGMLEKYWQPLRRGREGAVETAGRLHLCQARSNRGARGRKGDFRDAERLLKRYVAQDLRLSFVPDQEQRLWRAVSRRKIQKTRERRRLKQQLESLLEQAHLKLSSLLKDLFGVSSLRILRAIAAGEKDPAVLAAMRDANLKATEAQLRDGLQACTDLHAVFRRMLEAMLRDYDAIEKEIEALQRDLMELMAPHQEVVRRLAEIPGLSVDTAMQIIAEVGPKAAAFETEKNLASWIGICPGSEESAEKVKSTRSAKGNRFLRGLLYQAGQAAGRVKGSIFEVTFQRLLPGREYKKVVWAVGHRLCRTIWLVLHKGVDYEERGPAISAESKKRRTSRMVRELRKLGYRVEPEGLPAPLPA
jgi:transposase